MSHLDNSTARWREYGRAGSSSSLANPDFVNTAEGVFCRIGDKTPCPVSVVDATAGDDEGVCFNVEPVTPGGTRSGTASVIARAAAIIS